ncbi:MAG: hypothetical protein B6242_17180 [Anaerolineaceae bacterium 4572_78]|nr:MAG: hypothetical protein B6242_17180 [Anaerolineaceae bacterium 4572_78]
MKTPAGKECKYFFADYQPHRGHEREECRLLRANPDTPHWQPDYCKICPVPDILRNNQCPHLTLSAEVKKGFWSFLGFGIEVEVEGWCSSTFLEVKDPNIGCGSCHTEERPSIFDLLDE